MGRSGWMFGWVPLGGLMLSLEVMRRICWLIMVDGNATLRHRMKGRIPAVYQSSRAKQAEGGPASDGASEDEPEKVEASANDKEEKEGEDHQLL